VCFEELAEKKGESEAGGARCTWVSSSCLMAQANILGVLRYIDGAGSSIDRLNGELEGVDSMQT
jgi:hypothetical protein